MRSGLSTSRLRSGAVVAVATAALVAGAGALPVVAAAPPNTIVLTGEVVHDLSSYTDLGAVQPGASMRVAVALSYDQAARDAAYKAIYTPGSASYDQFLTPAQFRTQFGADPAVASRVRTAVTSQGLDVAYASPDGSYLELTGTADQVENTFQVSEHTFQTSAGTFTANAQAPTVPSGVAAVLGLTSLTKMTALGTTRATRPAAPAQDTCVPGQCTGILTPQDLWSVYDQPSTDRGAGQQIAIFGEGQLDQVVSNLRTFETDHGLPVVPVKRNLVGDNLSDNAGQDEWDLDSDATTGMSPDLEGLQYYFGSDLSDASIGGTYSAWANDPKGPSTGNSSFGGSEQLEYLGGFVLDSLLQQAAMEGRTMFASSGDGGGSCLPGANGVTNDGAPCVEYPASSPYVVGVGGTVLYTATTSPTSSTQATPAARSDEYSWTYSGGGMSDYEPAPSYQTAAFPAGAGVPCTMGAATGQTCRGVPDVSAVSGDVATNGYSVVSGTNEETESGGTSLSSPLWAGMWARVLAAHPAKKCSTSYSGSKLGFAQPVLYAVGNDPTIDAQAFFDVGGTTDSMPSSNGQQQTLPRTPVADPTGYDFVSGLGTPDVSVIQKAVDCGRVTPTKANKVPSSNDVTVVYDSKRGCAPNGTLTDPAGDEVPSTPANEAYDLRNILITSTAKGTNFSATVTNLAAATGTDVDYAFEFKYGSGSYAVSVDVGTASNTFSLYQRTITVTAVGLGVEQPPTDLSDALTGTVDPATNTISAFLPYSVFNSTALPTTPYKKGKVLSGLTIYANAGPAATAIPNDFNAEPLDQANFFQCTYKAHP